MAEVPSELVDSLPEGTADAFEQVFPDQPAASPELLVGLIRSHLEVVGHASTGEYVDTHLARVIADRLLKLLEAWDLFEETERAAAHAAVTYFVINEDAASDLNSPTGFDDDAQVANACFSFLGRADLLIDLE